MESLFNITLALFPAFSIVGLIVTILVHYFGLGKLKFFKIYPFIYGIVLTCVMFIASTLYEYHYGDQSLYDPIRVKFSEITEKDKDEVKHLKYIMNQHNLSKTLILEQFPHLERHLHLMNSDKYLILHLSWFFIMLWSILFYLSIPFLYKFITKKFKGYWSVILDLSHELLKSLVLLRTKIKSILKQKRPPNAHNLSDELEKLYELYQKGAITENEFISAKKKLFD